MLRECLKTQTLSHKCGRLQGNESQHSQEDFPFGNWNPISVLNLWDKVWGINFVQSGPFLDQ